MNATSRVSELLRSAVKQVLNVRRNFRVVAEDERTDRPKRAHGIEDGVSAWR